MQCVCVLDGSGGMNFRFRIASSQPPPFLFFLITKINTRSVELYTCLFLVDALCIHSYFNYNPLSLTRPKSDQNCILSAEPPLLC